MVEKWAGERIGKQVGNGIEPVAIPIEVPSRT
jgi:hypothetical protein